MGVSHRGDTDNADGATVIAGNLKFVKGSSGSSVIGAFISGYISVGTQTDSVTNLTVRFCNVGYIQVQHSQSSGMVVNQCYLRDKSSFGNCNVRMENNILSTAYNISGGYINHNIIVSCYEYTYRSTCSLYSVDNSSITNNIFLAKASALVSGGNNYISNNFVKVGDLGEECEVLGDSISWDDVFVANNGVKISSDYHFKDGWDKGRGAATDGTDIGIYGGSGFKDKEDAHAPIPRIVSKKVDEQTDGSGRLHIEVTVKSK